MIPKPYLFAIAIVMVLSGSVGMGCCVGSIVPDKLAAMDDGKFLMPFSVCAVVAFLGALLLGASLDRRWQYTSSLMADNQK